MRAFFKIVSWRTVVLSYIGLLSAAPGTWAVVPSSKIPSITNTRPVHGTGHIAAKITKTFTVPHTDGQDDSPAVTAALANGYNANTTILFKQGVTYNIWTPIVFSSLSNVEVAIEGNLTLPSNISVVQAIVANSSFPGYWFKFSGTNVTLRGSLSTSWGWINSHGAQWWAAQNQVNRPHLASFPVINGAIHNLKVVDSIAWNFALSGGKNIHAYANYIQCRPAPGAGFPFNTDGFGTSGTDVLIEDNVIINGDDCVTITSGGLNILARNNYCEGGHGLSIGSLGKGGAVASVHNVLFENNVMVNELYGARFKSWTGGAGIAQNITWKNIVVKNVPFPIYVTQNYWDQGIGPKPNTTSPSNTNIDNFNFINFSGTQEDVPYVEGSCVSDPCWYYVANATGHEIVIFDLYPGTATDITTKNLAIRTETGVKPQVMCSNTTITSDPGFVCQNGPYLPTRLPVHA